jgi:SpoVK/Ycf46/Vps4 family AAA+-type ATPase
MRALSGIKEKKKKKGKKKAKKKSKKKKAIKLPGGKEIVDMSDYEILKTLIGDQLCKYLPPASITEFIGEFNYIHSMLDDLTTTPYDPSMALIRQLVMEYVIFPLGSTLIRKRHPAHVRSILFYGPEGTGKTLMVRAVASETKSIIFDLSPVAIQG